ncbi:MAG TPA: hypothetical protein VLG09_05735 [Candidatus Saccharimonadales bacterium]|jgi:uncharacterized membrane protein|nr:hypothetical protein [Candidatus Saccharimonadales bacterium]
MNKKITIAALAVISIVVLIQSGILSSLVLFLLVGVIPGTSYSIPPTIMLLLIAAITWLVLFRLTAVEAIYKYSDNHSVKKHTERKKRMPRRRFSEI